MLKFQMRHLALAIVVFTPVVTHAENVNSDPVLVTASRFLSDAAEKPIAAEIITAQDIRSSAATTLSEVLRKIGGVQTRINFTGIPDSPLDLRGFGMTGDQNTLVLVNGQRISEFEGDTPARLSGIPLDAIERIEILRGSGAVLYGEGASAGTINIITHTPFSDVASGNVSMRIGSHNLRDYRGGVQAANGLWGISLYGQRYENDNYRDHNHADLEAVSGEVRYGDRDGFVALNLNTDRQRAKLPGARTELQLSNNPKGATTPEDYLNSNSQIITLRGEKRWGDLTVAMDLNRRFKQGESFGSGTYQLFGLQRFTTTAQNNLDVTSISPRVLWKTEFSSISNRLTIGADWSNWSYARNTSNTDTLFGNASTTETGEQTNRAFYVRNEIGLTSGTQLSLGGRKEYVDMEQSLITDSFFFPNRAISVRQPLSAYELALQQDLPAGLTAYGRLGRSYRIANIDENRCYSAPCPGFLEPQRSFDRELGMEWSGKDSHLRASLFQMDIADEIHYMKVVGATPFGFGATINLPPTRHRGLELEGRTVIGSSFDFQTRYTYTRAEFREGVYDGVDVSGHEVPLVPEDRVMLNLGWNAPFGTRMTMSVTYVGKQRYDNDQANKFHKMPSYTVADLKLSHDWKNWTLSAGINNLFDRKYYSYGIVNGTYTSFNAYPEDERNSYVSLEYQF